MKRNVFKKHQKEILIHYYAVNSNPSKEETQMVATKANLTFYQVHTWFARQRLYEKKKNTTTCISRSFGG